MSRVVFYNSDGEEVEVGTITYTRKQTNADRIRAMTDEELAHVLQGAGPHGLYGSDIHNEESDWLAWLREDAEDVPIEYYENGGK